MKRNLVVTALVAVIVGGAALVYTFLRPPQLPLVKGYLDGQEIEFIHTEASDPKVAQRLTDMKDSLVVAVPPLAQAPEAALATVYVFTNGVKGGGPLGFQPDVFDRPPGDAGYSPLRALNLVTWKDASAARVLRSAAEVQAAAQSARGRSPMAGQRETIAVSRIAGTLGTLGTLTCVGTMVLVAAGIIGVGAAGAGASTGMSGMAGMNSDGKTETSEPGGVEGFFIREGPTTLVVSIAAVTLGLAIRRRAAALPALLAGGLLYWGMYEQDGMGLMYATIAVGLLIWAATYLWVRGLLRRSLPRRGVTLQAP